ncbi:hypothetical protein GQR58_030720 [Nymphon striatum]|nr:hypothetical protein GQR58_030720 [Nymphon striatum]
MGSFRGDEGLGSRGALTLYALKLTRAEKAKGNGVGKKTSWNPGRPSEIEQIVDLHFLPARAAADELHHRLPAQRTELKPATAKGSRTPQGAVLRRHWTPAPDPFVQQNIDVNGDLRGQHQIALRHVDHRTPHIAF